MSEYQYYEFQTIDRRLDQKEMNELRGFSSRAEITPSRFVNEYSYGNFKGDADAWMEKYFDAYLYLANWGTHELQLRMPARLLSIQTARSYCEGTAASVRENSGNLIFTFVSNDEDGGDWIEGSGILSSLLQVRDDLIRGDLRALYIGWLLCLQEGELDDDAVEPPVPPGLGNLTASLSNLADFLRIDSDLLAVAATASPGKPRQTESRPAMTAWIASLPSGEKDELLVRLMEGKEAHLGTELFSRFNRPTAAAPSSATQCRTAGELLAAAQTNEQNRTAEASRKAVHEREERERVAAIAREKHLDSVGRRIPEIWKQIEDLLITKQPKSYDLALQLLLDMRDSANRQGNASDFARQVAALREAHSRKPSFIARLLENGL